MLATSRTRPALAATLAAATCLLTACSGMADDAPRDADTREFCDTFYDRDLSAQEVADRLADLGSPADLTDDERRGFELWVEGLDKEGDRPNLQIEQVQVPRDDRRVAQAFVDYVSDTCLAEEPTSPSGTPSTATPSATPS